MGSLLCMACADVQPMNMSLDHDEPRGGAVPRSSSDLRASTRGESPGGATEADMAGPGRSAHNDESNDKPYDTLANNF